MDATSWDIASYAHALTSQSGSDVWIESPSGAAFWVEDVIPLGPRGSVVAGLRYERFASGAIRPYLREVDPGSPRFDQVAWFPRISSYGYDGTDWDPALIQFREDDSHGAVGGSIRLSYAATPRLALRGGFGRYPQRPDFQLVYAGVNTDFAITTIAQGWGSDLDYEIVSHGEVGARYELGAGFLVDGAVWLRSTDDEIRAVLGSHYDPTLNRNVDLAVLENTSEGTTGQGLDLMVERRMGALTGWAGWSWQDVTATPDGSVDKREAPTPLSRSHELYLSGLAVTPAGWREGSLLGAVAKGGSMALAFRTVSGTPHQRCANQLANAFVLSGDRCLSGGGGRADSRTPMVSTLDLRLAKAISLRGTTLSFFLDARNVLGAENVLRVFSATGETSNPLAADQVWRGDSADYRTEAVANGALSPDQGIDLTFGGAPDPFAACGGWVATSGDAAGPNCAYLVGAERRFGDGDGIFTIEEQRRASDALYRTVYGRPQFLGPGRRVRVGVSLAL